MENSVPSNKTHYKITSFFLEIKQKDDYEINLHQFSSIN